MSKIKKAGLSGCFNDTGVTSTNYKEILYGNEMKEEIKRIKAKGKK